MAPKKITGYVKLQIMAGKATPAPPVGPALGQAQVNIMEFCKQFNERTSRPRDDRHDHPGRHHRLCRPHLQLHHQDASRAGASAKAAGIDKGSGTPNKEKKGKVTEKQILEIATQKMPDMNATTVEAAAKTHPRHRPFHGHRSRRLTRISVLLRLKQKGMQGISVDRVLSTRSPGVLFCR